MGRGGFIGTNQNQIDNTGEGIKKKLRFYELSRNRKLLKTFVNVGLFKICKIHSHSFPFSLQQIFRIYKKTLYVASGGAGENQQDVGRM